MNVKNYIWFGVILLFIDTILSVLSINVFSLKLQIIQITIFRFTVLGISLFLSLMGFEYFFKNKMTTILLSFIFTYIIFFVIVLFFVDKKNSFGDVIILTHTTKLFLYLYIPLIFSYLLSFIIANKFW